MAVPVFAAVAQSGPGFSAVIGDLGKGIHRVHTLSILGITDDLLVVISAGMVSAAFFPGGAPVEAAVKAALALSCASTMA